MRRSLVKMFVAGLAIASASLVATAQARPDLNGTWKMNPTQSRFSDPDAAPKDVAIRFEQRGQTLHETLTVVNFSDKGRKITVNSHDTNPDGQTDDLFVFEKQ